MRHLNESELEKIRDLLAHTGTVKISMNGGKYDVEYLIIPPANESAASKTPIFNYPGGLTHLAPCIESFLYLERESIIISPRGYGRSADPPSRIFKDIFHGAEVALETLERLNKREVIICFHSNAALIGKPMIDMSAIAPRIVKIRAAIFINPLGVWRISKLRAGLAHPISGGLTQVLSRNYDHPYKKLKDAYSAPKHPFSWQKILYEWRKSTEETLFLEPWKSDVPVIVIESAGDFVSARLWPWRKSMRRLFEENVPAELLNYYYIPGWRQTHNLTLGKDSQYLALIIHDALRKLDL